MKHCLNIVHDTFSFLKRGFFKVSILLLLIFNFSSVYSSSNSNLGVDTLKLNSLLEYGFSIVRTNADSAFSLSQYVMSTNNDLGLYNKGSLNIESDALFLAGKSSRYLGKVDNALGYLNAALRGYKRLGMPIEQSNCLHSIGNVYYVRGMFREAITQYSESLQLRDSLEIPIETSKTYANLGNAFFRLGDIDSALFCQNKSLNLRLQSNDSSGIASCYSNFGNIHFSKGEFNKALAYYTKAAYFLDTNKVSRKYASLINNIGNVYYGRGVYDKALEFFYKAFRLYEVLGDKRGQANVQINIGAIHMELGNYEQTKVYFDGALKNFLAIGDGGGEADTYGKLGDLYFRRNNYKKAKAYFHKAINLEHKVGDLNGVANCFGSLGVIYRQVAHYDSSEYFFNKAILLYIQNENKFGQTQMLNDLAQLYIKKGYYKIAIEKAKKAKEFSVLSGNLPGQLYANESIAKASECMGDFETANNKNCEVIALKDSLLSKETTTAILGLEMRYQNQKIQMEIEQQKILLTQRNNELFIKEKAYLVEKKLRDFFVIAAFLLSILLIYLVRLFIQNKKVNSDLVSQKKNVLVKNEALFQLNEELTTQRNHIEEQNKVLMHQKEHTDLVNKNISESINYAEYIQQALLPQQSKLSKLLKDYFVLNLPKDVVGGDFYWVGKVNSKTVVAVGDGTGHGVPGGFMSVLGLSLLKEVVITKQETDPAKILTQVRAMVIESLHQDGEIGDHADGIDMAIVTIDDDTNEIAFSGAGSNVIHTSKEEVNFYKGISSSLGFYRKFRAYENTTITVQKDDLIYFYTDGFCDQFSLDNQRFGRKRLLQLCEKEKGAPLLAQKEIFYQVFQDWKGSTEQIDDILVLAIRIK